MLADRVDAFQNLFWQSTGRTADVISGYRTIEKQLRLARAGRPAVDPRLSTHTSCPSTGADFRVSGLLSTTIKRSFANAARTAGLRVGGGSSIDPRTGIHSDWNHLDLGRRAV